MAFNLQILLFLFCAYYVPRQSWGVRVLEFYFLGKKEAHKINIYECMYKVESSPLNIFIALCRGFTVWGVPLKEIFSCCFFFPAYTAGIYRDRTERPGKSRQIHRFILFGFMFFSAKIARIFFLCSLWYSANFVSG